MGKGAFGQVYRAYSAAWTLADGLNTSLLRRCPQLGHGRDRGHQGDSAQQYTEERDWADHGACVLRRMGVAQTDRACVPQSEIDLLKNLNVSPPLPVVVSLCIHSRFCALDALEVRFAFEGPHIPRPMTVPIVTRCFETLPRFRANRPANLRIFLP